MNNCVTLIGTVHNAPKYYTTELGIDVTRLELLTPDDEKQLLGLAHPCIAYGPAAISLHEHLREGDWLAIQGELRYGPAAANGNRPFEIKVQRYTFLG